MSLEPPKSFSETRKLPNKSGTQKLNNADALELSKLNSLLNENLLRR